METKERKRKTLVNNPKNPFIEKIAIPTNIVVKEVNKNGKFWHEGLQYDIIERSEFEKSTKLFNKKILNSLLTNGKLDGNACKVLMYILTTISQNATSIALKKDILVKKLNFTSSNYDKPLVALMEAGIIAKKNEGFYWVNPIFLFSGNRIKFYSKKSFLSEFGLKKTLRDHLNSEDFVLNDLLFITKKVDRETYYYDKNDNLKYVKRKYLTWRNIDEESDLYTDEDRHLTDYYVLNGVDNYGNNYELTKRIVELDAQIDKLTDELAKAKELLKVNDNQKDD